MTSRRAFLRAASGVMLSAAGLPVLAACAPATPSTSTKPSSSTGASGAAKVALPTYVPLSNLPPADLPGTPDGLLAPGYTKYPAQLIRSVAQSPGKGGEVSALTASLSPAPSPLESN